MGAVKELWIAAREKAVEDASTQYYADLEAGKDPKEAFNDGVEALRRAGFDYDEAGGYLTTAVS